MDKGDKPAPKAAAKQLARKALPAARASSQSANSPVGQSLVSLGAAVIVGMAVGAAIEGEKPRGTPAHVHLSLGDDDRCGGHENHHYDDGQDCGL